MEEDFRELINETTEITGEQLHKWYLEATKELDPENYNEEAQKPYSKLNSEQKFIDNYIAAQVNKTKG